MSISDFQLTEKNFEFTQENLDGKLIVLPIFIRLSFRLVFFTAVEDNFIATIFISFSRSMLAHTENLEIYSIFLKKF